MVVGKKNFGGKAHKEWAPGESGNKSGVPKGGAGFAAMLREAVQDGKLLRKWLMEIASDPKSPDRMKAIQMISDRAFGKVHEQIEHTGADGGPIQVITGVPQPVATVTAGTEPGA